MTWIPPLRAWLSSNVLTLVVVGIVAFLVLTRVQSCRDSNDSADAAVMAERLRVDSAEKALLKVQHSQDSANIENMGRRLDLSLANGTKVIEHWNTSAPRPLNAGTAHDSITQLANQVKACRASGDELVKSEVEVKSACAAYKDTAKKALAHDSTRYAQLETSYSRLDSLLEIVKRGKRVQVYGDVLYEPLKTRPVVGLGMTTRLFWKLDGKVDAQYAIPRAKPDSTDGFRLLAGAHIRF
jgi:hypothetical protein